MKTSVLQSKDINTLSNNIPQLPPKNPNTFKKQTGGGSGTNKFILQEDKKKNRENTYSVNLIPTSNSRNGQYPHEMYSNQNLTTIPSSTKQKGSHKKKRSVSKSSKARATSPVPFSSFNIGSQADANNTLQQIGSINNNNSLILKRSLVNSLKSNSNNQLNLQISLSQSNNGNSSPLIKTTTSNQLNNVKGNNSPYEGTNKSQGLKTNKTASNFKISKSINGGQRKKSLISLEQSQSINQNVTQELNNSNNYGLKPQASIRIRSGKILNSSIVGTSSQNQNSSNKLVNQLSELSSLQNSQQKTGERIVDRNERSVNIFRVEEEGQENINSIQYTQFNYNYNDDQDENYNLFDNYNNSSAALNSIQNTQGSLNKLNFTNQLHPTQRQNNNTEVIQGSRLGDDLPNSRNKKIRSNSSKRRSTFSNSLSMSSNNNNNRKGTLILKNGEVQRGDDYVNAENTISIKPQQNNILRLQFNTKKHNWRDLLRSYLQQTQYVEIHLSFHDIIVEIYDGLIFNNQMRCLKYLNLNFKENKYFNDQSLLFLSAIKLSQLERVKINLVSTNCSRIGANFLLFDFNYVPHVEIIVGDISHEKVHRYTHEEKYIAIDFSDQKTISRSEILSLSDSVFKSNHKFLSVILDGVTDLNEEKLKILGRCIQEVVELHISFQNCNMTLDDLTQFIDGLTYINTRSAINVIPTNQLSQNSTKNQQLQQDPDKIIYDENDEDILASKPISFFIKKGINTNQKNNNNQTNISMEQTKQENEIIQKLSIDFRSNKQEINQKFMKIFRRFTSANTLKLFVDIDKQVKLQFDKQIQAFCLGETIKDYFNCIQIAVSQSQIIYYHDKNTKSIKINASNCGISAYQLVDIQRSLNFLEDITDMELDLSGNWQISYNDIKKMFDKLVYFDRLKRIRLNIKSIYIYEVEFITLYFLVKRIPDMEILHDFEKSRLLDLTSEQLKLNFKGPFRRSKINNILDMQNFCLALDNCPLLNLKDIQMKFFFNYGLRGDSLLRLCQSLGRFPRIEKLDLNFNSCFLTFNDIVFFCNGLNNIDITLKQLRLTFTNNEYITSNSLIKLAKALQRFPILDQLDIICESHELHLNPTINSYQHIFNKFNTKTAVSRRNPRQKLQVQRVIPKIYQVLAHDVEFGYQPMQDLSKYMKQCQNQYFSQFEIPFQIEDIPSPLDENANLIPQPSIQSENSISEKPPILPALLQIDDVEPPKRSKVVKSTELNWISLQFMEGVLYTDFELMNLGYSLALQETINHIITVPQKPILEKIFNEIKTARLAGILFSILVTPEMLFDPIQIFCDLYL
ncbi:hypothetical protein TTHERM_00160780 (macronuclear) [Tetrahymena thermophila SB210]|uniref:Uncharacterized protein n=1 Tax=Tetrahymena thermophila (strain SB210) TaxID=312017 RepID=Q22W54_TETTS|nr:hypothetical protein TTHERM_00160780 [Tetrahymena thermophila SB210]EAR89563.1 hypothetical protein TTHERM_00160780 [Tetrahymena thermophila SB210]|eukprot:XP_001009808.1 hypothetical protein TTHERM_00160780 [Tetrahymena thermophila SB210]